MKLNTGNNTLEMSGEFRTNTFSIKNSAKAFMVLSDKLYNNKIRAIVRELSCNAYDSHRENGTEDVPFRIKLPTALDSKFIIRDYGTGLSEDQVINLYTTYFESTKEDSNDVIGCLGLGSKSPFCYTKSFNVVSYFNGTKTQYSAYINAEGFPQISKIFASPTDEKNGLEIVVNAKKDDYYKFRNECTNVLMWFPKKPTLISDSDTDIEEICNMYNLCGKNGDWGFPSEDNNYYHQRTSSVMGFINYSMADFQTDLLSSKEEIIYNSKILMFFELGELDISPSRESLSYSDWCIKNIKAKLSSIYDEIVHDIETSLSKETNAYDFYKTLYAELMSKYPRRIMAHLIENELSLTRPNEVEMSYTGHAIGITQYRLNSRKKVNKMHKNSIVLNQEFYSKKNAILVADRATGHVKLTKHLLNTGVYNSVYIVTVKTDTQNGFTDERITTKTGFDRKNLTINNFNADILYLEESAIKEKTSARKMGVKSGYKIMCDGTAGAHYKDSPQATHDAYDELIKNNSIVYYITYSRVGILLDARRCMASDLNDLKVNSLIASVPLVAMTTSRLNSFEKRRKKEDCVFINFEDYIVNKIKAYDFSAVIVDGSHYTRGMLNGLKSLNKVLKDANSVVTVDDEIAIFEKNCNSRKASELINNKIVRIYNNLLSDSLLTLRDITHVIDTKIPGYRFSDHIYNNSEKVKYFEYVVKNLTNNTCNTKAPKV